MSAMIPSLSAKLVTCVDPFIYTLNQPKIRTDILRRLGLLQSINPSAGETPYYPGRSSRPVCNTNISQRTLGSPQRLPIGSQRSRSNPRAPASPVFDVVDADSLAEAVNINSHILPGPLNEKKTSSYCRIMSVLR